jgi:hypothetical protein
MIKIKVKNTWPNGKINKNSLLSKLSFCGLELKEGEEKVVSFEDKKPADDFVKYAVSIGFQVSILPTEEPKVEAETKAEKKEKATEEPKVEAEEKPSKTKSK